MNFLKAHWFPVALVIIFFAMILREILPGGKSGTPDNIAETTYDPATNEWNPPDITQLPNDEKGDLIRYGHELIANTSYYFGPKGNIASITNGMNCQNCHVEAGTRYFGNCFSAVASLYPTYRPRSGIVESIEFRVNDCMKRSLNGQPIDSMSKEMRAMVDYLKWLGKDVPKGVKPKGANSEELVFLNRAADTAKGQLVYVNRCQRCHGTNGEGALKPDQSGFIYPPLWGPQSYNSGAGLFRLSRFAGYVKNNMPSDSASFNNSVLTNEQAWDVAAYVNSRPRPEKTFPGDWPDLTKKAIDYPFGPYADGFPQNQHKYGPFIPIKEAIDKSKKNPNKNAGR